MSAQQLDPATDPAEAAKSAVRHLIWGSVPTLIAIGGMIFQATTSFVAPRHQWLFEITVMSCMMFTLTIWIWCTVMQVRNQFKASDEAAAAATHQRFDALSEAMEARFEEMESGINRLESILLRTERSLKGMHQRVDKLSADHEAIKGEHEHLRTLIIESAGVQPLNGQKWQGPRSLS